MRDGLAMAFGFVVLFTAAALAGWEIFAHQRSSNDFRWLHTKSRLRRRLAMSALLVVVGVIMLADAYRWVEFTNVRHLMIYVLLMAALAMALVILSIRDLVEMARNAEQQALNDLRDAVEQQARKEKGGPRGETE